MHFFFCFGAVHLSNAVFSLAVISQMTIFDHAKFPQCIQGELSTKNKLLFEGLEK